MATQTMTTSGVVPDNDIVGAQTPVEPEPDSTFGGEGVRRRSSIVNKAYVSGSVQSLIDAHDNIDLDNIPEHPEPRGGYGGDYIKSFVFGGLDGIVSTFALVAGLGGANVNLHTLIAVSLAKVLADAFSMGFGEFTSATAELEAALKVKDRESWEMENHMEGEVKEMCQIYVNKGCTREDALTILTVMAKYKDLFLEHMLMLEHDLMPPDDSDRWQPLKQGFVCFLAFAIFGFVPLAGFIVYYAIVGNVTGMGNVLVLAYCLTATTLFIMGATKARLTGNAAWVKSGAMMVFNGSFAGGMAYLIGDMLVSAF